MIGKDIELLVVDVRGDCVRIGIKAPEKIGIWRKELLLEVERQNLEAVDSTPDIDSVAELLEKASLPPSVRKNAVVTKGESEK